MGIDATAKPRLDSFTPRHRVPKDVLDRLDLKDYVPSSWLTQKTGSVDSPRRLPVLKEDSSGLGAGITDTPSGTLRRTQGERSRRSDRFGFRCYRSKIGTAKGKK